MADTKYVRLADRLSGQVIADLETGWSIAGLDVKEVPTEGPARGTIRRWVQTGVLEPASKAEFDEVKEVLEADNSEAQEHTLQSDGEATRAKIRASRANNPADSDLLDDSVFDVAPQPPPPVSADGAPERLSVQASTTESKDKRGGRR